MYDNDGNEISEEQCPHPVERMKPLRFLATEGRANPKGIPYLYLATSKETSMSEIRPWIGSEISVAQFKIKKELTIVDCSECNLTNPFYFDSSRGIYEPSSKDKEKSVWAHIDKAFSEPVVKNDNRADYAPTQILAELFKNNGFDGVAYKSMLSDGNNVVLFHPEEAEMLNCSLYVTKNVIFEFGEAANPYFVQSRQET
ncbi:RES family NAD+ phosphorylase [Acidithiobacillus thiooxidans]|uniref:RES family NAD+ phosphorylase n=1 Tax=Acidithiobacillus thiooxidans TaxID=930 RepID=UPI001300C5BF|nr:RES family NAD+ phosphorylase [Acidithiobacillus thiooxidans]MBU2812713.1 RES family NAD+ phosphorylase [Acidithiobacillus thiooxidans]